MNYLKLLGFALLVNLTACFPSSSDAKNINSNTHKRNSEEHKGEEPHTKNHKEMLEDFITQPRREYETALLTYLNQIDNPQTAARILESYGSYNLLQRLNGTDKDFRKSVLRITKLAGANGKKAILAKNKDGKSALEMALVDKELTMALIEILGLHELKSLDKNLFKEIIGGSSKPEIAQKLVELLDKNLDKNLIEFILDEGRPEAQIALLNKIGPKESAQLPIEKLYRAFDNYILLLPASKKLLSHIYGSINAQQRAQLTQQMIKDNLNLNIFKAICALLPDEKSKIELRTNLLKYASNKIWEKWINLDPKIETCFDLVNDKYDINGKEGNIIDLVVSTSLKADDIKNIAKEIKNKIGTDKWNDFIATAADTVARKINLDYKMTNDEIVKYAEDKKISDDSLEAIFIHYLVSISTLKLSQEGHQFFSSPAGSKFIHALLKRPNFKLWSYIFDNAPNFMITFLNDLRQDPIKNASNIKTIENLIIDQYYIFDYDKITENKFAINLTKDDYTLKNVGVGNILFLVIKRLGLNDIQKIVTWIMVTPSTGNLSRFIDKLKNLMRGKVDWHDYTQTSYDYLKTFSYTEKDINTALKR